VKGNEHDPGEVLDERCGLVEVRVQQEGSKSRLVIEICVLSAMKVEVWAWGGNVRNG